MFVMWRLDHPWRAEIQNENKRQNQFVCISIMLTFRFKYNGVKMTWYFF